MFFLVNFLVQKWILYGAYNIDLIYLKKERPYTTGTCISQEKLDLSRSELLGANTTTPTHFRKHNIQTLNINFAIYSGCLNHSRKIPFNVLRLHY